MQRNGALFAVCFLAGLLAGLVNSLFIWGCGVWGVTSLIGVKIIPTLEMSWLYPRMVWGGIWALPYFFSIGLPRYRRHWIRKALWFSLLPTAAILFYFFPQQGQGMGGLKLGTLTPLFVLVANLVWGVFTGFFTRLFWGR